MSMIKFARCRYFLTDRRDARVFNLCLTTASSTHVLSTKHWSHDYDTDGLAKNCYTTSVKPHMTPSMQKWKQKKRKSKTQQKKEMDKLHEDLVKLLSKRAIEFVKNKSLFEAQRGMVTTHVFTSFPHTEGSTDTSELQLFDLRKHSDYVAETVEAHLLTNQKVSNKFTEIYTDGIQKLNISPAVDSNIYQNPGLSTVNGVTRVPDSREGVKDTNDTSTLLSGTSSKEHNIQYFTPSLADIFTQSVKHTKTSSVNFADFQSNLEKFKSELETALEKYASTTESTVHAWNDNNNIEQHEADLINNEEYMDKPLVKNVSHNKRISVASSSKHKSLPSNDLKLSDHTIENEIEFFRAELSELDMSNQPWDPYNSGTSLINSGDFSETFHEDSDVHTLSSNSVLDHSHLNGELQSDFSEILEFSSNYDKLVSETHTDSGRAFERKHSMSNLNLKKKREKIVQQIPKIQKNFKDKRLNISDTSRSLNVPKSKSVESSLKLKSEEKDSKRKLEHINVNRELQELTDKSFAEVSCFTNSELIAIRNLQYQASRQKLSSVEVFNRLIHALAKKRDLQTIKSLFTVVRKQELTPTLQMYAGCLECIGRLPEPDIKTCAKLLADINKKGLELKEIANTCSFESDEWDYVLKAIRLVDSDFVPNPPKLISQYDNKLLTALNTPSDQAMEKNQYAVNIENLCDKAKAQFEMEKQGEVLVKSISSSPSQAGDDIKWKIQRNKLFEEWKKVLLQSFERKLEMYRKKSHDNVNMTLYPYLKLFPPEEYVNIIFKFLKELLSSSEGYSQTQAFLQSNLGRAVNRKYNTDYKIAAGMGDKMLKLHELYIDKYLNKNYVLDNHRLMWLRSMSQNYDTINMDMSMKRWPAHIQKQIGKFLLEMILYDLKVNANLFRPRAPERVVPAFCSIFRPDISLTTNAEIKLHPVLTKLFHCDHIDVFTFDPSTVPMVIPPVPWISKNMGGLLLGSNSLVRLGSDMCHVDVLKTVTEKQYPAVLDSLNTLSACAWKINQPILDLQIEIFNNKGDAHLKVARPASELPPMPVITEDMSSKDKAMLYRERIQLQQQKNDMHGLWCTDLYRLSIANKFRDEVFWFPHSLDFRGRTYPLPPHFNHLGSDNVRSMLLFAKGKPLGKHGYDWLKIHLINLTGFKKRCSNAERLDYAQSLMNEILDSADKPLAGNKWWQTSDEPWQTLACCMEIAKIERFEGSKEDYVCHFPVHQDGSCNGLQHYAALGRDQAGAESVNLHPYDVPQDVYSDVVELVEKTREKHAGEGNEIAEALKGFIKRKVIKQTIMTTVYGVTRYGAKLQIHRQLKDISEFPSDLAWRASLYLTETTFTCLREMFTATKDIQDWLTESARLISTVVPVEWSTPLGFPVLQPYFKRLSKAESKHDKFKPNIMKQKNAFPPNYIHSLDSTHMMLTSLYCMHAGLTFVSVHDCYWTHASDVTDMNRICREQFVNMHKQPLLEDLSEHLISVVKRANQDPNLVEDMKKVDVQMLLNLLSNVPKRGSFDIYNVLKSTYFFS